MLTVISPAKTLDFDTPSHTDKYTEPRFLTQSQQLIDQLKKLSSQEIAGLMKISDKLAGLNMARFQQWETPFTEKNAKQAILAFKGDVYTGLNAETLNENGLAFAQQHLRILSGLYGVLRPLDLIQPYRLEMGTKLANDKGETLYDFWKERLTKQIEDMVADHKDKTIICLASNEYIKAVDVKSLNVPFVTCHFKEVKDGTPKVVGLFAKRARGMMARYMIEHKIDTAQGLKAFDSDGYSYEASLSSDTDFVFLREG